MIEQRFIDAGITAIAGVDEAGRGACAGPLVVAAVILSDFEALHEVRDSKELSATTRERLYDLILEKSRAHSIIHIPPAEVDENGLQRCNIEGMRRAIQNLSEPPEYVLTDGYPIPGLAIPSLAVWKGDQVALTISAASILAKVSRDREMRDLDLKYPGYGLADHKGYATAAHRAALERLGVSPIHRRSYSNIAALINN